MLKPHIRKIDVGEELLFYYLNLTIITVALFKRELEEGKDPRFWANLMLIERLQMFVQDLTRCDFLTIFMEYLLDLFHCYGRM